MAHSILGHNIPTPVTLLGDGVRMSHAVKGKEANSKTDQNGPL